MTDMTDALSHRGPDGQGLWLGHTADKNFQIGLGHRRLSIIDIAGGVQPMWSEGGEIALVFNGEIYNYLELRSELTALGRSFQTVSDTEVLIVAYQHWGAKCLERFRGMFAFALWDTRSQQLLIARDPFGKKPLFVAQQPGQLVFASEIESILKFPGIDRGFDADALSEYLINRYVPGPSTFFRGIKKLLPGCFGVWKSGQLELTRYYTPPVSTTVPNIVVFSEAVERLGYTLDEAVKIRMRSDAPYGAYLSGGIDSSMVVATMVNHSSGPVRTFSVGFAERAYSELESARAIAEQFGTDHHELVVTPNDFLEAWPLAVKRRGAPVSEASDIPILMLSCFASSTVKMVLTGEGADELMGGYPKHRAEPWVNRYHKLVPRLFHDHVVHSLVKRLPYGARRLKVLSTAARERDFGDRMRVWFGGISPADRDDLLRASVSSARQPDAFPFSAVSASSVRKTLFFDQTSWLPDNLLERGDRMMMAGSIEGRMPFMDTDLAALVARFPDRFLVGHRGSKSVLRELAATALPASIVRQKKLGFRVPFNEWFRGPYKSLIRDLLLSSHSNVAKLCREEVLGRLVNEHFHGQQNNERVLWNLANLEMFLRNFPTSNSDAFLAA